MGVLLGFKRQNAIPQFTVAPAITGTAQAGQTLSVGWEAVRAKQSTVEWYSWSDGLATQGQKFLGASTSLTVPNDEVGRFITSAVVIRNSAGSAKSVAGPTTVVIAANAPDPYFSVPVAISGTPAVGETLTMTYTPVNATTELKQWYAYTNTGGDQTGRLTLGTGLTQVVPAEADGYFMRAEVRLLDADGDEAFSAAQMQTAVTPGSEDPGAPELPRVTPGYLPPTGWDKETADVVLTDSTDLQAWVNANAPIDTSGGVYVIELTAGDVWQKKITFPSNFNTGENWIVFRTSNFANLPAEGDRLQPSPANDADLATIEGTPVSVKTPQSITASGSTATITFAAPHGLNSTYYTIEGVTVSEGANPYNKFEAYCTVTGSTTLTYPLGSTPTDLAPTGGTMVRRSDAGGYIIDQGSTTWKKLAFVGVQFRPALNAYAYQNVYFNQNSGSNDLLFYQCRFTTGADRRIRDTMLMLHGTNSAVSCCDFFVRRRDYDAPNVKNIYMVNPNDGAFAVRVIYGNGVRIYNNRLQSGGPSVFISDSSRTSVPFDVTIDKNYLVRPREWEDIEAHKNAFEYKGVQRLLMEGNIIEWTWDGLQPPAHLLVLKNASSYANDITIRNNILRSGVACIAMEGSTGPNIVQRQSRTTITNNLFYDINRTYGDNNSNWHGELLYTSGPIADLRITKNTFVASDSRFLVRTAFGSVNYSGFVFRDNVICPTLMPPYNSYIWGWNEVAPTPTSQGLVALNTDIGSYDIQYNVWTRRSSAMLENDTRTTVKEGSVLQNNYYYTGSHLQVGPNANEPLFVDYDNENYRITPTGYLANKASDGGPPGANIDVIEAATANVETGTLSNG